MDSVSISIYEKWRKAMKTAWFYNQKNAQLLENNAHKTLLFAKCCAKNSRFVVSLLFIFGNNDFAQKKNNFLHE